MSSWLVVGIIILKDRSFVNGAVNAVAVSYAAVMERIVVVSLRAETMVLVSSRERRDRGRVPLRKKS